MSELKIKHLFLNRIFALAFILEILNWNEFKIFLNSHESMAKNNVFKGFLFYTKSVCNSILNTLSDSKELNLEEDITFSRADFVGIPLSKLRNTCQKTIFIKNLHGIFNKLWNSKNVDDFLTNKQNVNEVFIRTFKTIQEKNVKITQKYRSINKDEIIRRLSIYWNYIYFTDTGRGVPQGYFFSMSEKKDSFFPFNRNSKTFDSLFQGYKLTLIFIWKQLLGKEVHLNIFKKMYEANNWQELDAIFMDVRREIILPLEKEFRLSRQQFFEEVSSITPSLFNEYFFKIPPEPILSKDEELQQILYWYPVQAVLGQQVFSGVAAFTSTLVGVLTLRERFDIDNKVTIIRFVHPEDLGNTYSYGVLIEVFGTISDYSGWLISYDCCTDFSGFGGSNYYYAEEIIKQYSDSLNILEYSIESEVLLQYFKYFSVDVTDAYEILSKKISTEIDAKEQKQILEALSLSPKYKRLEDNFASSKGLLLELIAYYYFTCDNYYVIWRFNNSELIDKGDVDIVVYDEKNKLLNIVFCMSTMKIDKLNRLDKVADKLRKNSKKLENLDYNRNNIQKSIFIPKKLLPNQLDELENRHIDNYVLQDLFTNSPQFTRIKKGEIVRIFELKTKN